MPDHATAVRQASAGRLAAARRWLGTFRLAYLPVLITYFAYGASAITAVALVFFQKDALRLTPAEVAGIGFWLGLPWSMKMVAGVASDCYPIFGSRRAAYLLVGALCSLAGFAALATVVHTKGTYLAAMVFITVGFMVQDVVADALSVQVAETEEEIGQIQTLGRMALLAGGISVGYLSGWLAAHIGVRATFAAAMVLPLGVAACVPFIRASPRAAAAPDAGDGPLGGGKAQLVLGVGLAYAAFSIALEVLDAPFAQEVVLVVSAALIGLLLHRVGISRAVAIAAIVIFMFRATPGVGQGYSYWAIDRLGFDQKFLGLLAQVSSVLSLAGLLVFRGAAFGPEPTLRQSAYFRPHNESEDVRGLGQDPLAHRLRKGVHLASDGREEPGPQFVDAEHKLFLPGEDLAAGGRVQRVQHRDQPRLAARAAKQPSFAP